MVNALHIRLSHKPRSSLIDYCFLLLPKLHQCHGIWCFERFLRFRNVKATFVFTAYQSLVLERPDQPSYQHLGTRPGEALSQAIGL